MNIGTFTVGSEYKKVSEIIDESLESEKTYSIQNRGNGYLLFAQKEDTPTTDEGILIAPLEKVEYTHSEGELWVYSAGSFLGKFNIAK